ncbi:MAG: phosphate ABC transporter substrate-binding protein PstS [Sideroxydans sp.]|nr:phosphate ABC transporter substrate-binding protein PstS [Sideroxydans sp.]
MFAKLLAVALTCCASNAYSDSIFGVGATFPNSVYQAWGKAYQAETGNQLIYTPVGSGKGLAAIIAAKTDFGASDKPLKMDELKKSNLLQFPMVIGGVVPVVNLKGIASGELVLNGATLAAIFMGQVTRWNDPVIRALNPSVKLPDAEIIVVTRSDKSGTTFNFSNYLSKVSPDWRTKLGEGLHLAWPVGIAAEGTKGVAKQLSETANSISYMDLADAQARQLSSVKMFNRNGTLVTPNAASFAAAAAAAKWSAATGYYEILTDQAGANSWPITAATFILLERTQITPERGAAALKFFDWAYRHGNDIAHTLHYVPLPDSVAEGVRAAWHNGVTDKMGVAIWR